MDTLCRQYTHIVGKYYIYIRVCTSFRNVKKREHVTSLSDMFHSDWKLIIYFPTIHIYCNYRVMSKAPKQLSNFLKREETSVVLIIFDYVLCEVRAYKFISINDVNVSYRRSTNYFLVSDQI
jgi:protein gp37